MIEKCLETAHGETLYAHIKEDEDTPATLIVHDEEGTSVEIHLGQGNIKALRAWLKAALHLQRWC